MHTIKRPYASIGVALAAGTLALSPISAPPGNMTVPAVYSNSANVALTAAVDPLTRWGQVAAASGENLNEIGTHWLSNPLPLTRQVASNVQAYGEMAVGGVTAALPALESWVTKTMPTALEKAAAEWQAGQPAQATKTISAAVSAVIWAGLGMAPVMSIPYYAVEHAATLIQGVLSTNTMTTLVTIPLNIFGLAINSFGATAQAVTDAVAAGDTVGAIFAAANGPADMVDTVLNGRNGLIDYRGLTGGNGVVTQLLLKIPERLAGSIALPTGVAAAVESPGLAAPPAADTTVNAERPAPEEITSPQDSGAEPAPTTTEDDSAPVAELSSNGATDLSAGNKAVPGKTGTTSTRPAQQLRASVETAASQVTKGLNDIRDGIEKSVSGLKAGVKKASDGKTRAESNESDGDNS